MFDVTEARRKQLEFVGLTEEDLKYLSEQREHFAAITNNVVDRLYEHIYKHPELAKIINDNSTIERLKETQRWYFMTLVEGKIDMEFIERRLYIGKLHSRIGLTTDWYLGTYMTYLDLTVQGLQKSAPNEWMKIVLVLSRMFNFDSQLVLEAYEHDEKLKVQSLYEERDQTLSKVSKVVQELSAMMVELSGSSHSIANSANNTAELQEKAYQKVDILHTKIGEIANVGELLQQVSDQTHLLGLNASIEAAHAAEYGRGFGIVANEIRKLALHSKESLEEVKSKLEEISTVLNEVMQDSEQTFRLARDQAASSQELTAFIDMIETVTQELEKLDEE